MTPTEATARPIPHAIGYHVTPLPPFEPYTRHGPVTYSEEHGQYYCAGDSIDRDFARLIMEGDSHA